MDQEQARQRALRTYRSVDCTAHMYAYAEHIAANFPAKLAHLIGELTWAEIRRIVDAVVRIKKARSH